MKRISVLIFAVILCFIMSVSAFALAGDVNSDGTVTAVDARLILRYSSGLEKVTDSEKEIA